MHNFWPGYGPTWDTSGYTDPLKADAQDRARLFASILQQKNADPELLENLQKAFDQEGTTEQDRLWDQVLSQVYPKTPAETGQTPPEGDPTLKPAQPTQEIWNTLWMRNTAIYDDALQAGWFANTLLMRDPLLEQYANLLHNPKSLPDEKTRILQNLPLDLQRSAADIATHAHAWSQASQDWKTRARRIFDLRKVQKIHENDEMSAILLEKIRDNGIQDNQIQYLLDSPDIARHVLQSGLRGIRYLKADTEIEEALEKARNMRKPEHVRDYLDSVFDKHHQHMETEFTSRGHRWKARYALAGGYREIPGIVGFRPAGKRSGNAEDPRTMAETRVCQPV